MWSIFNLFCFEILYSTTIVEQINIMHITPAIRPSNYIKEIYGDMFTTGIHLLFFEMEFYRRKKCLSQAYVFIM